MVKRLGKNYTCIRISTAKHLYVKPALSRAHPCSSQGSTTKLFFMVALEELADSPDGMMVF